MNEVARVDISLRNFLCLSTLKEGRATAFHLGSIVRIGFVLAYLRRLGYLTLTPKQFRRAERGFSRATERFQRIARWELEDEELESARQVVHAFDICLAGVPLTVLAHAHRYANANLSAPLPRRLSMSTLADDDYVPEPYALNAVAA